MKILIWILWQKKKIKAEAVKAVQLALKHNPTIKSELKKELRKKSNMKQIVSEVIQHESQIEHIEKEIKDIKKSMHDIAEVKHDIKQVKKNLVAEVKEIQKVKTTVHESIAPSLNVKKLISHETPHDALLRAFNKVGEKNNHVLEKISQDRAKINAIQKQLDATERTRVINQKEAAKLIAEIAAINNSHTKAVKDMEEHKKIFKDLVKKNILTQKSLSNVKNTEKQDKKECDKATEEARNLKIRIESLSSEKHNNAKYIENIKEQIKILESNGSLDKVLNGQLSQLEKQKTEIDRHYQEIRSNLDKQLIKEVALEAALNKTNASVKSLEHQVSALEKEIADAESKYKVGHQAIQTMVHDIAASKASLIIRNKTNTNLENELKTLRKQTEVLGRTESTDAKHIKELEVDSLHNKRLIHELEITVKQMRKRPDHYPIANWNFSKGSLKDEYEHFQSETVGVIPMATLQGKQCALFKDKNYIKILGGIDTNSFKSVTMMVNVQHNSAKSPRLWEFTNEHLGGDWCKDSVGTLINKENDVGFYAKKDCTGPELWSSSGILKKSTWEHIAFVMNGTLNEITLYVNGKKSAEWSNANSKLLRNKRFNNMYILQSIEQFAKDIGVAWFRIFKQPLSAEHIITDMNNEWRH